MDRILHEQLQSSTQQAKPDVNLLSASAKLRLKYLRFKLVNSSAYQVYCTGKLLHEIQMNKIFVDSKTFVDMPSKFDHKTIWTNSTNWAGSFP